MGGFQRVFGDWLSLSGTANTSSPTPIINDVPYCHEVALRYYMAKPIPRRAAYFKDAPVHKVNMAFVSQLPQHRYCLASILLQNAYNAMLNPLIFTDFLQSQLSLISYSIGTVPLIHA